MNTSRHPRPLAAALVLGTALAWLPLVARAQPGSEWDFVVRLDGREIGHHRFVVARDASGMRDVSSDARFEVTMLGWTAYRYLHRARERWSGDCLAAIEASTDDAGQRTQVRGRRTERGFEVEVDGAQRPDPPEAALPACVMSFAYWNPALVSQRRLLDPGTGRLLPVQIAPLPSAPQDAQRGRVEARGWRLTGLPNPIDLWYDGDAWIGLDTQVAGGRRLSYRLR